MEELDNISLTEFQSLLEKHEYDDVNNSIDFGIQNLIQILFDERCEWTEQGERRMNFNNELRLSFDRRYKNTTSLIKERDGAFIFILDRLFNNHGWDKYPLISEKDKEKWKKQ